MSRFREFDFESGVFQDSNPEMKRIMIKAYKSKMTASQFIEEVQKSDAVKVSKGKQRNRTQYRNAHKIDERYRRLDGKFNFFGNYEIH